VSPLHNTFFLGMAAAKINSTRFRSQGLRNLLTKEKKRKEMLHEWKNSSANKKNHEI
jgi:hypothetical protein